MIKTDNRTIIYRYKWLNIKEISNLTYCHFLVDGDTLKNIFYFRILINRMPIYFYHDIDDIYDVDDITHFTQVYQNDKVFHVYAMQNKCQIDNDASKGDLAIRLITIDNDLIKEKKKEEKTKRFLI